MVGRRALSLPAILRSTDGGSNFVPVWPPAHFPQEFAVTCNVLLATEGIMFAGTSSGLVMGSVDQGQTWDTLASLPGMQVTTIVRNTQHSAGRLDRDCSFSGRSNALETYSKFCYELHSGVEGGCAAWYTHNVNNGNAVLCNDEGTGGNCGQSDKFQCSGSGAEGLWRIGALVATGVHGNSSGVFKVAFAYSASATQTLSVARTQDATATATNPSPGDIWQMAEGPPVRASAAAGAAGEVAAILYSLPRWSSTVLRSTDAGNTWEEVGHDAGLSTSDKAQHWASSHWTYIRTAAAAPGVAFAGGFAGLHKTTDGGETWVKLDVLVRQIFELKVSPIDGSNRVLVGACTYANDCFGTTIKGHLHAHVAPPGTDDRVSHSWETTGTKHWQQPTENVPEYMQDYNVLAIAPHYATKGVLIFRGRGGAVLRSGNWGDSWSVIDLPLLPAVARFRQTQVRNIVISPNFRSDKTLYVSGINIGVTVSTNGGKAFRTVFSPADSYVTLSISPTFATDDTLVAIVAAHRDLICAPLFKNSLHISTNRGRRWTALPTFSNNGLENVWESLSLSPAFAMDKTMVALTAVSSCNRHQKQATSPNIRLPCKDPGLNNGECYHDGEEDEDEAEFTTEQRQIMISRDAGQTWSVVKLEQPLVNGIHLDTLIARRSLTIAPTFASTGEMILALQTAGTYARQVPHQEPTPLL